MAAGTLAFAWSSELNPCKSWRGRPDAHWLRDGIIHLCAAIGADVERLDDAAGEAQRFEGSPIVEMAALVLPSHPLVRARLCGSDLDFGHGDHPEV